ncbi:hypothetical protein CPC08DRAFT_799610 [Agrocybe pediades]|nr:hypothetical protein CPC08DRAFT_799610 [Agrocybe pediades]
MSMHKPKHSTQLPKGLPINLGYFTVDKENPLKKYYNPVNIPVRKINHYSINTFEAFRNNSSSTELDTSEPIRTTRTALKRNNLKVYNMVNQLDWFDVALSDEGVRSWIDDRLKEKENIYLVLGYMLLDRVTVQAKSDEQLTPPSASDEERPTVLERGVDDQSSGSQQPPANSKQPRMSLHATFEGDTIYAVEYQKLKFGSFLRRRNVERAQFPYKSGHRWTMMEYEKDEVGVLFQPEQPPKEWKRWSKKIGKIDIGAV